MTVSALKTMDEYAPIFSLEDTDDIDCSIDLPNIETFTAHSFLKSSPPARKYVFTGFPFGRVGILAAPGGTSKTMLLFHIAFSVASGQQICGGLFEVETPGSVVVLAGEEDKEEIHRRIYAIARAEASTTNCMSNSKLKRLHFVPMQGIDAALVDENGEETQFFIDLLEQLNGIDDLVLVVVDPLRRFFHGDENASNAATRAVVVLERIPRETGASVLAAHHTNKSSMKDDGGLEQYAARGSSAFTDGVRWQMNLKVFDEAKAKKYRIHPDERRFFLEAAVPKNNCGPPQDERLFLKRGNGGALQRVHLTDEGEQTLADLQSKVVEMVRMLYAQGKSLGKAEFVNIHSGTNKPWGVGRDRVQEAINQAIQNEQLQLIASPTKGKGRPPKHIVPYGKPHPLTHTEGMEDEI